MRVPAVLYGDESLIAEMDDKVLEQIGNVACLPGIVDAAYTMPDAHWGYGFPIGGVAAFDPEDGGVVSAGGVGFDISCGVRTLLTGLKRGDIEPIKEALADSLYRTIPAGLGSKGAIVLDADRDGPHACRRRALGLRTGVRARRGPRSHRGGGCDARCPSRRRVEPRQGAPARRDGHARLGQSLPRSAGGDGDLGRRDRRGLWAGAGRGRRQHPLRLARPRPPDRHRFPARDGDCGARARNYAARSRAGLRPDPLRVGRALSRRDARRHQLRARQPPDPRASDAPRLRAFLPGDDAAGAVRRLAQHLQGGRARGLGPATSGSSSTARARPVPSAPGIPSCRRLSPPPGSRSSSAAAWAPRRRSWSGRRSGRSMPSPRRATAPGAR